jgi:hypothetical protein
MLNNKRRKDGCRERARWWVINSEYSQCGRGSIYRGRVK